MMPNKLSWKRCSLIVRRASPPTWRTTSLTNTKMCVKLGIATFAKIDLPLLTPSFLFFTMILDYYRFLRGFFFLSCNTMMLGLHHSRFSSFHTHLSFYLYIHLKWPYLWSVIVISTPSVSMLNFHNLKDWKGQSVCDSHQIPERKDSLNLWISSTLPSLVKQRKKKEIITKLKSCNLYAATRATGYLQLCSR